MHISASALASQLLLGLVNGSFYATLSLGLAVIFGLLNVINFAHGAMFTLGAMTSCMASTYFGLNYWAMLAVSLLVVGCLGILVERFMLRRIYKLDPLYGLLLTLGLTLVVEGALRSAYGASGHPYEAPDALSGATNLGFMLLPAYRVWVVAVSLVACVGTWWLIERPKLGSYMRAGAENPRLVEALGINVPLLTTLTYGSGAALAALAGVLAAPVTQVSPLMGQNLIIVVFAVVVIGGMGSIVGAVVTGLALGVFEGLTKVLYAPASSIVVFVAMVLVLLVRPSGIFGKEGGLRE